LALSKRLRIATLTIGAPGCKLSYNKVRSLAGQRAPHQQTAWRITLLGQKIGALVQQVGNHAPRRRRSERFVPEARALLHVAVERPPEQSLLIAECGIEARRIDSHRLGQRSDGRTFVAIAPKNLERPVERPLDIKLSGTSHSHDLEGLQLALALVTSCYQQFSSEHYISR
jgi:hypothetical protein